MIQKFTRELYDLFVKDNIGLVESLRIMKKKPGKRLFLQNECQIQKTADYLLKKLENGNLLSNAMKSCTYMKFDKTYISIISLAERSGNLKKSIIFLKEKFERDKENKEKMISVFIYPAVVICFAFVICVYLCTYFDKEKQFLIYRAFFAFFCFCILVVMIIKKNLEGNKLYEAFFTIGFMVDSGIDLANAVGCGSQILGIDSKLGKKFITAKERLEYGMSLENAFSFDSDFQEAFYYADQVGRKSEIFSNIAEWMSDKCKKKRNAILLLIEPLFITITGIFLLILVVNFFMPFMNDFSWV